MTPTTRGEFWAAGSEGLAAYYDGSRWIRRDYPLRSGEADYTYSVFAGIPTATVVMVGSRATLFGRHGDVLQWSGAGWQRLQVVWPAASYDVQVDHVFVHSDGTLFVRLHDGEVLEGSVANLRSGDYRRGQLPGYCDHIEKIGDELFALGWDSSGSSRALYRRGGKARRWDMLGILGKETESSVVGVIALRTWKPLVVSSRALIHLGAPPRVSLPMHYLSLLQAPTQSDEPLPMSRNPETYVTRAFADSPDRALILINYRADGEQVDALELRAERFIPWTCDERLADLAIGGFWFDGRWRVVRRNSYAERLPLGGAYSVVDLPGPTCRELLTRVEHEPKVIAQ